MRLTGACSFAQPSPISCVSQTLTTIMPDPSPQKSSWTPTSCALRALSSLPDAVLPLAFTGTWISSILCKGQLCLGAHPFVISVGVTSAPQGLLAWPPAACSHFHVSQVSCPSHTSGRLRTGKATDQAGRGQGFYLVPRPPSPSSYPVRAGPHPRQGKPGEYTRRSLGS